MPESEIDRLIPKSWNAATLNPGRGSVSKNQRAKSAHRQSGGHQVQRPAGASYPGDWRAANHSIITADAAKEMRLKPGDRAAALIKSRSNDSSSVTNTRHSMNHKWNGLLNRGLKLIFLPWRLEPQAERGAAAEDSSGCGSRSSSRRCRNRRRLPRANRHTNRSSLWLEWKHFCADSE